MHTSGWEGGGGGGGVGRGGRNHKQQLNFFLNIQTKTPTVHLIRLGIGRGSELIGE